MPEKSASAMLAQPLEVRVASLDLVEPQPQFARVNRVLHVSITEASGFVTLRAEVPGFDTRQLEISLEPRRLTLLARKSAKNHERAKTATSGDCSCEVLRVFDLPVEIDTAEAVATLRDGILELRMRKLDCAQATRIDVKAV